jgi:hypothetical protein
MLNDDYTRTYRIELPRDAPPRSIRQICKKQITGGARWNDKIEIRRDGKTIVSGVMSEVSRSMGGKTA